MEQLSTVKGAPVTALQRNGEYALLGTDLAGRVYANAGSPDKNWWGWIGVSQGKTMPGAPVTALSWENRIAVFVADPTGGVFTTAGDPRAGFGPWATVSQGQTTPGAPVTAVPFGDRIALFLADAKGEVFTTGGDPQGGFGPWVTVSQGSTTPGGMVTAIPWQNRIALFLADPNGGVFTAAGDPQAGFKSWASVSEGHTLPGAPVTVAPFGDRIGVFLADPGGGVFMTGGDPQAGFGPWVTASQGRTTPGGMVTAVPWQNGIALFLADPGGEIFWATGDPQAGFGRWETVGQGRTVPGAPISAVPSGNGIVLFVADPNGGIFAATLNPQTRLWSWTTVTQFPPGPAAYQLGVLPPDPTPTIPDGDEIILYLHGGPGSRIEEASDLVGPLLDAGLRRGKRYTLISFDQPSQGYTSMLAPNQIVPVQTGLENEKSTLIFSEDFIFAFLAALDPIVSIHDRPIYAIGGSTGGMLSLRLGHRKGFKRIVAWSAACVWHTYAGDSLKVVALTQGLSRSTRDEDGDARKDFFNDAFGPVRLSVLGNVQPNPEEWYRGDRDSSISEWPCKWDYIAAARLDYEEVYNSRFRQWHWRLGTELLYFSFFNTSWAWPAVEATEPKLANYWHITTPTLLAAAEDDDWDEGPALHWENRWERTWEMARLMANTPGYTLFLPYTGHSIHNERPKLFAEQIAAFLTDPGLDSALGPLQVLGLFPRSEMPEEDRDCLAKPSQLSRYPGPPEELLQNPDSAAILTRPALKGGLLAQPTRNPRQPYQLVDPGTYSLRLKPEFRDVAQKCRSVVALGNAAARYYLGDPMWAGFADLAVTGHAAYESLRSPLPDDAIAGIARAVLPSGTLDEDRLADAVLTAKTRAYKVAWVLRDPDRAEGFRLRPAWGWIAVSAEDDAPARPVNVTSGLPIFAADGTTQISTHPQFEVGVQMLGTEFYDTVSFQVRYTIASLPVS